AMGLRLYMQNIQKMFRNPFYCGYIVHGALDEDEVVKGRHEALVSEEIFLKVQRITEGVHHNDEQEKENDDLPLKQHVFCGNCGTAFTGYLVKKKNLYYYKCNKKGCKCNRSAKKMHQAYQELLLQYQVNPAL